MSRRNIELAPHHHWRASSSQELKVGLEFLDIKDGLRCMETEHICYRLMYSLYTKTPCGRKSYIQTRPQLALLAVLQGQQWFIERFRELPERFYDGLCPQTTNTWKLTALSHLSESWVKGYWLFPLCHCFQDLCFITSATYLSYPVARGKCSLLWLGVCVTASFLL